MSKVSLAGLLALLALACTGDSSPAGPEVPVVASVALSPSEAILLSAGDSQQFTATGMDRRGNELADIAVSWATSDPTVATVSLGGLVTAVGAGVANIVATSGTARGTAPIKVQIASAGSMETLAMGLQYPTGLWVRDGAVFLTEAAEHSTSYGGRARLSQYTESTGELEILVDRPMNYDVVVAGGDGSLYLGSWQFSIPGESGRVSRVTRGPIAESALLDLGMAATDMFIDTNEDIYVTGASPGADTPSLIRLPVDGYTTPEVLEEGLGYVFAMTRIGSDIFFAYLSSAGTGLKRRNDDGSIVTVVDGLGFVTSMTSDGSFLYLADYSSEAIGRLDPLSPDPAMEVMVSGLLEPTAVRYDDATGSLYFLSGGTNAGLYHDGTLTVLRDFR